MSPPVNPSSRLRTAFAAVVAAAGFLAASPRASADTVSLHFNSTALPNQSSSGVTVQIGSDKPIDGIPGPYNWTAPAGSGFPNPTITFCSELTQSINTGNSYTYTVTPLAQASEITSAQATAISELYAGHYTDALTGGAAASTAFQLALWAIIYDTDGNYKLTGRHHGNLYVQSVGSTAGGSSALSTAKDWLASLGSQPSFSSVFPNQQILWLSNSNAQDQIAVIPSQPTTTPPPQGVPAPPGVLLGLIGLGGCMLGRGFRRRTATAVTV
jgi:hypothetical protein